MKLLLISGIFPPYTSIGSLRAGKLAKFFHDQGHDVHVITAGGWRRQISMPVEIPVERIHLTQRINLNLLPELIYGGREKIVKHGYGQKNPLTRWMAKAYRSFIHIPDEMAGWTPFATQAAKRLVTGWQPDLIYCTGMPFTGFIISDQLSRRFHIPWVAEYRDLWSQNAFYEYQAWRRPLDRIIEKTTVRTASALVVVSPTYAEKLGEYFRKPVAVIYNGFDPADFEGLGGVEQRQDDLLKVVYPGAIYQEYQDIRPLFQAVAMLGDRQQRIEIHIYSRYFDFLEESAAQFGVEGCLKTHALVPYREALQAQRQADILLHLGWNDPAEKGILSGKLFGYLGARRPILSVGPEDNISSKLIREREAGFVSNDPSAIAHQLAAWLDKKDEEGIIPDLPASAGAGFTRQDQFTRLENFLMELLSGKTLV